jgi:LacI family transcriptional regulator
MENAIFARGLQAFQETLADNGVTLLVASSGYDPEKELQQIKTLISQGADGLLLIGHARPEKTYNFLKKRKIPCVLTWNYRTDATCFNVGFNNQKAAAEITRKVIEHGHQQIGMLTGQTEFNDRAVDRITGVRGAMAESGLSEDQLVTMPSNYSLRDAGDAFMQLIQQHPKLTAIICGNDVLATGAIVRATEMGIKIPDDISITGFDDIDLAEVIHPKLTTVHVPHRRMGQSAAMLLLEIINGETDCRNIELQTEVKVRESLGPAASF